MTLRPGWINRQLEQVGKEVANWPAWMRHEGGLNVVASSESMACGEVHSRLQEPGGQIQTKAQKAKQ